MSGLIGSILLFAFQQSGMEVSQTQIDNTIVVVMQVLAMASMWYGRYRQGDVNWFGKKKTV